MDDLDDVIQAISDELPRINTGLLIEYRRSEISAALRYIDVAYAGCMEFFGGHIVYKGYDIMGPKERAEFELARGEVTVGTTEATLVRFKFQFRGREFCSERYIPYLTHDTMGVKLYGKLYNILLGINDRIFSRTAEGITIRVIRDHLRFLRNTTMEMIPIAGASPPITEFISTANIHRRKVKGKPCEITVLLYFMAKFGIVPSLERFGISVPNDVTFAEAIDADTDVWDYYQTGQRIKRRKNDVIVRDPVYVKIRRGVLQRDVLTRKVLAALLYTLAYARIETLTEVYDTSTYVFLLGRLISDRDEKAARIYNEAYTHLVSVDHYLDAISQVRMMAFGVMIRDMYDLFAYIITDIDTLMVNSRQNDLFAKRIDIAGALWIEVFVKAIFGKAYNTPHGPDRLTDTVVRKLTSMEAMRCHHLHRSPLAQYPSLYNPNWVLAMGVAQLRLGGSGRTDYNSPSNAFHPSLMAVRTAIAMSKQKPGEGGAINPFVPISDQGGIEKPTWASEIDAITKYLPQRC